MDDDYGSGGVSDFYAFNDRPSKSEKMMNARKQEESK